MRITQPYRSEEIIGHLRSSWINDELALVAQANDGRNLNWGIHVPDEDKKILVSQL